LFFVAVLDDLGRPINESLGSSPVFLLPLPPEPPALHRWASPDFLAFLLLLLLVMGLCLGLRYLFGDDRRTVRYPGQKPGELGPRKLIYPYAYKKL
jgi:hypothetical protein